MLHGVVHAGGVPTIVLPVAGKDWLATIDTGFNGDLELPEELRDALHARYVGRATAILAGDQSVTEDVFVVDFPFDRRSLIAQATFVSGSQILVGTHLLREYVLHIDFTAKTVELDDDKLATSIGFGSVVGAGHGFISAPRS